MASINFMADLQEIIIRRLSNLGHLPTPGEDLDTLLIRYLNLIRRMPPVISWNIKKSKELISKSLSEEIRNGLQQFIIKAESGQDLKPHISTKINDDPDYNDLMFYDWGVFHFHLGTDPHPKRNGFIKRTDELLFAIADISLKTMYLIDIHPHTGGFTNQDLLRIIEENWVEIVDEYTLKGVVGLTYNASDNDIYSLRKAGINTILQTPSGRILAPMGGGISTAGTSVINRRDVNSMRSHVQKLENWFIQQRETLTTFLKKKYNKDWDDLNFKLVSFEPPVKIQELTTGEIWEIL